MKISSRMLTIIYILLDERQVFTSKELSKKLGISVRTIKNDIAIHKEYLPKYGIDIKSKKGSGYYIEIINKDLYEEFFNQILYKYSNEQEIPNDFEERLQYIIRRLISTEKSINLEDLADELFLVKRSLGKEIKSARKILKEYNLKVENRSNYGIMVKGSEFSKRLCQVDYYMYYYHKARPNFQAKDFQRLFDVPIEIRLGTRQMFLEEIRKTHIVIKDFYSQKFPVFLLLAYRRYMDGNGIRIDENEINYYKKFKEFTLVDSLTNRTNTYFDQCLPVEEKIFLTIIFLAFRDIYPNEDYKYFGVFYKEAERYGDMILASLYRNYNIKFFMEETIKKDLMRALIPLSIRIKYNIIEKGNWGKHIRFRDAIINPLAVELSYLASRTIYQETKLQICEDDIYQLAFVFINAVNRQPLNYKKRNILAFGVSGYDSVQLAIERIQQRYGQFIDTIDVKERYQIEKLDDMNDYDFLLIANRMSNNYCNDLPKLYIDEIIEKDNFDGLYNDLVLSGVVVDNLLPKVEEKGIFRNMDLSNKEDVYKFLAYKNTDLFENSRKLVEYFNEREEIVTFEGKEEVVILFNLGNLANKDKIEILSLEKPILWDKNMIRYVVYFQLEYCLDSKVLRSLEVIAKTLFSSGDYVEKIINSQDSNIFNKILRMKNK